MENTYKIYIIIVTYNAMRWADKCFSSLRSSNIPVEVVVVDNGSNDGTQDFIQQKFPEVHFIQSSENLGFGKANNIGIEYAYKNGAEFFYLMNQDAWLFPDSIEKLLEVYDTYHNKAEIGILSPMHLDGSGKKLDVFLDKYIAHNFKETRLISDLYFQTVKVYYEISFINAAHWFLPKSTIETVGGFNPYFFHYGEDNEYVNRLHFHQQKVLLCPHSKVVHDGKQNLDKVDYTKFKNLGIETNIINPNLENRFQIEKKSLQQSILKNILLGKFNFANQLKTRLNKINKEKEQLLEIRTKVAKKGTTFLSL